MSNLTREELLADEQRDRGAHALSGLTINQMVRRAHRNSYEKGWWDAQKRDAIDRKVLDGEAKAGDLDLYRVADTIPEKLMLIVTEAAEAMECYRDPKHAPAEAWTGEGGKPEGLPAELADIVIRIGDLCGALGIDLEAAVLSKMAHNERRAHRHGGKRA